MSSVVSASTRLRVGAALRTEELEFLAPYDRLMKHYIEQTEPEILKEVFLGQTRVLLAPAIISQEIWDILGNTGVFLEGRLWRRPPHA